MSEPKGMIFNIQKFSLHDGPGIRTVVFFKGCPLRCAWCANPESQLREPQLLSGEVKGKLMSLSEVLEICMQDRDFYEESGGGVTLSGGEPLVQPEFAAALLGGLKAQGIHTAMETTGYAVPEVFDRVAAKADLLLFDVKHWDVDKHKQGTGVSNERIFANLRGAISAGKNVLPRIPVIPGFNNSLDDAAHFAALFQEMGAKEVQLLPFHQFGESKYELLGREYAYANLDALHEEDLSEFQQVLTNAGIHTYF